MDTTPRTPSRRVVIGAAAWTIPAVAIVVASPMASASGEPDYILDAHFQILPAGDPVKVNWKHGLRVWVTNTGTSDFTDGFTLNLTLTDDVGVVYIGGLNATLSPSSTPGWTAPVLSGQDTLTLTFAGTVPAVTGSVEAIITPADNGVIAFSAPDPTLLPYGSSTSEYVLTTDPTYSAVNLGQSVLYTLP